MPHRVPAQVRVHVYAFLHPLEHAKIRQLNAWHKAYCANSAIAKANKAWEIRVPNGECYLCRGYGRPHLLVALNWVHRLVIRMDRFFVACDHHSANVQIRNLFGWLP